MSNAEAIETVSSFILDAPPGELQDVISDVKALIGDDPSVMEELAPAIKKYNKDQLVAVKLPGGSKLVIISEFNDLGDDRFYDIEAQSSFKFDHSSQKASDVKTHALESGNSDTIKTLIKNLATHVDEHYPSMSAYGAYPIADSPDTIALLVTGVKYSPGNYWNGRWRSIYRYDVATSMLTGEIKVDVHYYEDGNVRLLTKHVVEGVSVGTGEVVRSIARQEKAYQEKLNDAFGQLSEGAFKSLRRQLPITRQKIDWDKIGSYRLGQQVGLFPSHEQQS